jgi:flagellar hook assembly protein FlgD
LKGQKVKTLIAESLPAGYHSVIWNGTDERNKPVASGIYFYKLKTKDYSKVRKMLLLK